MFSRLDRGPPASVRLYFDGSASPNPGPAAWGAEAFFNIGNEETSVQWSARIGDNTSNVAEYLGLIGGLRRVLNYLQYHNIRHSYVHLEVLGDSQLVINQVVGRSQVRSAKLRPLYRIARQLVLRFMDVEFISCSRQDNATADRLATRARQDNGFSIQKAAYYPNLGHFADAWVQNVHTLASHDVLTSGSDPSCIIDATFLYNLPEGKTLFSSIRDPYPLSMIVGKVHMTVLGTVTLDIGVVFARSRSGQSAQPQHSDLVDVIVVHSLPVPIHVSHRNSQVSQSGRVDIISRYQVGFDSENLPEPFGNHPYWNSNTIFIGFEG